MQDRINELGGDNAHKQQAKEVRADITDLQDRVDDLEAGKDANAGTVVIKKSLNKRAQPVKRAGSVIEIGHTGMTVEHPKSRSSTRG